MGIYGTYAHKLMESQNEPIYICEFDLKDSLNNIKLSIKRFLYNLLNKIERWLNKRKDTKLRNTLLKLVTKCKDLINKNNSCEEKSEFERISKESQELGKEFNEAIFVERYINDNGNIRKTRIAADIGYQILNKFDIDKLFSDPRIESQRIGNSEYFKTWKEKFETEHPKNTWNKDIISLTICAAVAEIFNKEYCYYLYDMSKYVNGIIVNK